MPDPLVGSVVRNHEVVELLARGATGRIYRLRPRDGGAERAMRLLAPELLTTQKARARFLREAALLASLRNPFLAPVHEYGSLEDGTSFLLMDLPSGQSLRQRFDSKGALGVASAVSLVAALCRGLETLHRQDIVHRDVSPDGVVLVAGPEGETPVLADYGLGLPLDAPDVAQAVQSGLLAGRVAYVSPEQAGALAEGEQIDLRSDIYSLGVLLYEALTGRTPFSGSASRVLKKKFMERPTAPSALASQAGVSEDLDRLVLSMLEKKRDRRPRNVTEVRLALEKLARPATPPAAAVASAVGDRPTKAITSPDMVEALDIGAQIEEYTIEKVLGAGGMGKVFQARHRLLGVPRALKVVTPRWMAEAMARERFLREARILALLEHPNLVRVYDCRPLGPTAYYMVQELVEGESLGVRLKREGKLRAEEAVKLFSGAARGLAAAHDRGIVHRDVSPDNMMVINDPNGEETVKIIDFGIAKAKAEENTPDLTVTQAFVGKLQYCSPEQAGKLAAGEEIDGRSDVYSLGVVLYRVLTGRLPFEATTPQGFLAAHLTEPPPPPRTLGVLLTPKLEALLLQMLEKDRRSRPQTMQEVARRLEALVFSATMPAEPAPEPSRRGRVRDAGTRGTRGTRPARSSSTALVAAVLALGIGGAAAAWLLLGRGDPAPAPAVPEPPRGAIIGPTPDATAVQAIVVLATATPTPPETPPPAPEPTAEAVMFAATPRPVTPPPRLTPLARPTATAPAQRPDPTPSHDEELARRWEEVRASASAAPIEEFLRRNPDLPATVREEARALIATRALDSEAFRRAEQAATLLAFDEYLRVFPSGSHRKEVEALRAQREGKVRASFQVAESTATAEGWARFRNEYPDAPADLRQRAVELEKTLRAVAGDATRDDDTFAAARGAGKDALIEYLKKFPRGRHLDEALELLDFPRQGDLALLLARNVGKRVKLPDILNRREAMDFFAGLGIAPCVGIWQEDVRLRPDDYKCIAGLDPRDPKAPATIDLASFSERIKERLKVQSR